MTARPLSPIGVRRGVEILRDEVGRTDRERLKAILRLLKDDGRLRISSVLGEFFPDHTRKSALTAFRQFRQRLREAAGVCGIRLTLVADNRRRSSPEERWCWFEGEDRAADAAARFSETETHMSGPELVSQNAVLLTDDRGGRPVVRYFLSYAHKDASLKERLLEKLRELLDNAGEYVFELWEDREILVGERWREEIQAAVARCQLGLLFVSPSFLASRFIVEEELSRFLPSSVDEPALGRRALPVALRKLPMDGSLDLKGLKEAQLFFDGEGKAFSERRGQRVDDFAQQVFAQILEVVSKYFAVPPPLGRPLKWRQRALESRLLRTVEEGFDTDAFVPTQGFLSSLEKRPDAARGSDRPVGERLDALDYLTQWAANPNAPAFCALLGEYGIGKTTTCKAFARQLLEARKQDADLPLPIYLDLRALGDVARANPQLEEILETALRGSWRSGEPTSLLTTDEVLRLVREEGALVIFDGLDEVLVHLSPTAGQRFTRELWRVVPPRLLREQGREDEKPRTKGKLLVSCRTHYFRSLREQKTHLTGEGREGIRADDYRALVLLPFTEKQIRSYLEQTLPDDDPERLMGLIRSFHDLAKLSVRPYTLSLVAESIPWIEGRKHAGEPLTAAALYDHLVRSWLERDSGKHQLTPDHKGRLMEYLAAALWRSGGKSWSVGDLEQWLIDFLVDHPRFAAHYEGRDREILKEDLRTATFLVREGEDRFRFAHTSLQEYFLARYLHTAMIRGQVRDWALPMPNEETFEFLGQILGDREPDSALGTLRKLRDSYVPFASEAALNYFASAYAKGFPAPPAVGFELGGASLRSMEIGGSEARPLDLGRANLRGADLRDARLSHVLLDGADLSEANLRNSEFLNCSGRELNCSRADLTGTLLRHVDLSRAIFNTATFYRTQFLACELSGCRGVDSTDPGVLLARCAVDGPVREFPSISRSVDVLDGHTSGVWSCAFSPDGRRLASGGGDGTVRLWDTASRECVAVIEGHGNDVWSCAFSPDGRRLASAGHDGTVRLWDTDSRECVAVFERHGKRVNSCVFSPDGRRLASAGDDGTVRLWDTGNRECEAVLEGHGDWVWSCDFSPDGRRLASGGADGTVRLWDADSRECVAVLEGHGEWVSSCVFSPDGRRLASAGHDGTVRLWDTNSRECVAVLEGHRSQVRSCAFSPEGRRLASGGDDGTVRLWDTDSRECVAVLEGHREWVNSCAFSPDGRRLASGSGYGTVRLWDTDSRECVAVLEGHGSQVMSCAFSPDGRRLASGAGERAVRLWDTDSRECVAVLEGHEDSVWSCAFSPDGRWLASGGADGTVRLWDTGNCECVAILEGHGDWVYSCAFSPDGRRLASGAGERAVRLWDTDSRECVAVLEGHEDSVWSCAFSPDGRRLASGGADGTVRLWDTDSRECVAVLEGHGKRISSCVFSPDGRGLASGGGDGTVRLWDTDSRECVAVLEGHEAWVWSCAFSPDGRRLASGGADGTVRLWDTGNCECVAILEGHGDWVYSCAFSPDGRRLASAGDDGTVRLWDSSTLTPIARWKHFRNGSWAAFEGEAGRLARASGDAWRWLGYVAPDPRTGKLTRLPAETFGPIHGID